MQLIAKINVCRSTKVQYMTNNLFFHWRKMFTKDYQKTMCVLNDLKRIQLRPLFSFIWNCCFCRTQDQHLSKQQTAQPSTEASHQQIKGFMLYTTKMKCFISKTDHKENRDYCFDLVKSIWIIAKTVLLSESKYYILVSGMLTFWLCLLFLFKFS